MGYWKRYLETDIWDPVPTEQADKKECVFLPALATDRKKRALKSKYRVLMYMGVGCTVITLLWLAGSGPIMDKPSDFVRYLILVIGLFIVPNLVLFFVNRIQLKYWFFFDPRD